MNTIIMKNVRYDYEYIALYDMKNAKIQIYGCIYIAYDYRITIIIRKYEICIEYKIHMDCLLRTW